MKLSTKTCRNYEDFEIVNDSWNGVMVYVATVLLGCKKFYENFLDFYYSSAFLFIAYIYYL